MVYYYSSSLGNPNHQRLLDTLCLIIEMACSTFLSCGRGIIVNADDFGYCQKRNEGIIHCIKENAVTSVSVLINGENGIRPLEQCLNYLISVGLHFNISEGTPLSPTSSIPTLLNEKHKFLGKFLLHEAATSGNISTKEVETELRSQLQAFEKLLNCSPTHVDGHQHVHVLPGIREAFVKVLCAENIQWTRMPIELEVEDCFWLDDQQKCFFKRIIEMAGESSKLFKEFGLKYTDSFVGLSTMGKNMTLERLKHAVTKAFKIDSPSICELMVHPGYAAIPGVGGCGEGPDDFALSSDREHEIKILCSKEWKQFLKSERIQLLSFKDASQSEK